MSHLDEEQLTALLDGELSDIEARQAREHLAQCADCSARFEEVKAFFNEANRLVQVLEFPQIVPAPPLAPVPVAAPARRRWPLKQLAWAASLFLAVGLGYYGSELRLHNEAPVRLHPDAPPELRVDSSRQTADALQKQSAAGAPVAAAGPAATLRDGPAPERQQAAKPQAVEKDLAANTHDKSTVGGATNEGERRSLDKERNADAKADVSAQGKLAKTAAPVTEPSAAAALTGAASQPAPTAENSGGVAALARRDEAARYIDGAPASPGFRASNSLLADQLKPKKVTLEEAVQALGGTIHLIDGMSPDRVEQLSARAVAGAHGGLPVIRVIYLDAPMREIWLDQQRGLGASAPRDTITQWTPDGGQNMQWMTGTDDWLSLTAHLTADSLKVLAREVR